MTATPQARAAFGINTYSFTRDLHARDCLQQLATAGYRRFEVMLIPGHFWPTLDGVAGRREIESLVARNGLEILTLNQPNLDVNLASAVPEMRQHSCTVIANAIELAQAWNAKGVVINPGKANPVFPPSMQTLADNFRRSLDVLLPVARRASVQLIVKNHPLSYLYRAQDLRQFFDAFGWEQIGLAYDFANGHFGGEEPQAVLHLWDHLSLLYAADTSTERFDHAEIGKGTVAYGAISTLLQGAKACPPTILEIVSEHPQSAIDASVEYLDLVRWPTA
jgi:sugar phosphate isomerase/epimerase